MAGNRIVRSVDKNPRVISDRTVSGALLPATMVAIGAIQLTQATAASGVRLALLADRDFYGAPASAFTTTDPLRTAYVSGETGHAVCLVPDLEVVCAVAAATYTNGQELTVGAAGRLVAATTGTIVVAYYDEVGAAKSAGDLVDVVIANFYTKA